MSDSERKKTNTSQQEGNTQVCSTIIIFKGFFQFNSRFYLRFQQYV